MARLNEILVGRFNRGLQKLFGIKGSPPVATLAPELMPVHGLASGAENRYLEGWMSFGVFAQSNAVAANTSGIRLRNPTNSGIIAVIYKLGVLNGAANQGIFSQGAASTDLATTVSVSNARFDARGNPQPTCILSSQNTTPAIADLGTNYASSLTIANSFEDLIVTDMQEIPLLPGDATQYRMVAINTAALLVLWWRERPLEESERA